MPTFVNATGSGQIYPGLIHSDGSTLTLQPGETVELAADPHVPGLVPQPISEPPVQAPPLPRPVASEPSIPTPGD